MSTLNLQVNASADDSDQQSGANDMGRTYTNTGACTLTRATMSPGSHATNDEWTAAFRFTGVTIAQGSTIDAASFILTPQAGWDAAALGRVVKYHVSTQAHDNAPALLSTGSNLTSTNRPRSTADVAWTQSTTVTDVEQSVSVISIIQEIINRAGWVSGNAIVIILDTHADTTIGEWQDYQAYDGSTTKAAKLNITYTVASNPLPYDALPTCTAIYSLRRCKTSYTGNLIEVRRSNDNAVADIGYDIDNNLDFAALKTHVGANSGYISKMYDQSGNAATAAQATAANQPLLVSSGVIQTAYGRPTPVYSNDQYLQATISTFSASTVTAFGVQMYDATGGGYGRVLTLYADGSLDSDSTGLIPLLKKTATLFMFSLQNATFSSNGSSAIVTNAWEVHTVVLGTTSNSAQQYRNGVAGTAGTLTVSGVGANRLRIGADTTAAANGGWWGGGITEVALSATAWSSTDRNALEQSLIAYWLAARRLSVSGVG